MKPKTRMVFDVDRLVVTDIFYGDEHYVVEGKCNKCGKCCRVAPPVQFRLDDGSCKFLTENNLCAIEETKPWYCRFWPYDLECFEMNPVDCPIKLRRVP